MLAHRPRKETIIILYYDTPAASLCHEIPTFAGRIDFVSGFTPHILQCVPELFPKVWGGHRLQRHGKAVGTGQTIGESWEIADLPESIAGGRSVIGRGPWQGRTLRSLIDAHPQAVLGCAAASDDGGFPLLIKYLDAAQPLSIQVHPSPSYAARHPGAHLKSEAWYVVAADEGACIYAGLANGVSRREFKAAIAAGDDQVVQCLNTIVVQPGDCVYLPSGTPHALGAGILVAEVQTPSDTTFRIYDWGRTDRALHVEAALECVEFDADGQLQPAIVHSAAGTVDHVVSCCLAEHFEIERFNIAAGRTLEHQVHDVPEVWMLIEGSCAVYAGNCEPVECAAGDTLLLPAGLDLVSFRFDAVAVLLRILPRR
ncbi:MAG: type I phosphomannose isomerase catalytic subunit [Phycisphaerales bacterium]